MMGGLVPVVFGSVSMGHVDRLVVLAGVPVFLVVASVAPVRARQRSVVVMPELLVQRGVQSWANLESCQPQRAQEQRVNPAEAAMGKKRHGKDRNPTRVSNTIRTLG